MFSSSTTFQSFVLLSGGLRKRQQALRVRAEEGEASILDPDLAGTNVA
jgi:hypothetical protein